MPMERAGLRVASGRSSPAFLLQRRLLTDYHSAFEATYGEANGEYFHDEGRIAEYLQSTSPEHVDAGFLGYLGNLTEIARVAPQVARSIVQELADQRANLKLIASENYCSLATQLAMEIS